MAALCVQYASSSDDAGGLQRGLLSGMEASELYEDDLEEEMVVTTGCHGASSAASPSPLVPSIYESLPSGGERFTLVVEDRCVSVQCELRPRPRLRVLLDGVVRRETGVITRGLRVQLLGHYDLSCRFQPFPLGGGLSLHLNHKPVAHSFWDPTVLLRKARFPAAGLMACLSVQVLLVLFAMDVGNFATWQWGASAMALGLCLLAAGLWEWIPVPTYWATVAVGGVEMVWAGTAVTTDWALDHQNPQWLVWCGLCLFWVKAYLIYLLVRCMP
eukprot:GGOE01003386.1.p1 GENE.GGOE01003386.1~~GGOE01003386.1.p1  ORF type:complete len:272 (-),score=84.49 GGOE01003386.1:473-1288(-)